MELLKSENSGNGFYGEMHQAGCADAAWAEAMTAIAEETGAEPVDVRAFLDSVWGRHFADCAAFGWQPHTARAAVTRLRRAGFDIKAVKVDGKAAYRFNGQGAPAQEPAADSLWNGVSEPVTQFYQRRAAVLAAAS